MKTKNIYLFLCVIGAILPTWQFTLFFLENGADINLFLTQPFSSRVGTGLVFDLLISCAAFFVFAITTGRAQKIKHYWISVAAVFLVGLCLGLPLFLYLTEKEKKKS
jgi:hypothetical protein